MSRRICLYETARAFDLAVHDLAAELRRVGHAPLGVQLSRATTKLWLAVTEAVRDHGSHSVHPAASVCRAASHCRAVLKAALSVGQARPAARRALLHLVAVSRSVDAGSL